VSLTSLAQAGPAVPSRFQHEAFVYRGNAEFVASSVAFIRAGLAAGEPVMVAVIQPKIDLIRAELDGQAHRVRFVDMAELGRNPARILPAWREFAEDHGTRAAALRGIGEPVWGGRRAQEVAESQLHEALLNLAFDPAVDGGPRFRLRCPYDAAALDREVIEAVRDSHPVVADAGGWRDSGRYAGPDHAAAAFADLLSEPPPHAERLPFGPEDLPRVREIVVGQAERLHLGRERTAELVLAVHEVATNSLRYGGDGGLLRVWRDSDGLVCDIRDRGRISEPLVGRTRPSLTDEGGRGLWLANQLCDLVQIRSSSDGTVVRLHMWL
jgi:anti-sigma regulatory factor (Ser/Thr protein kinase)